MLIGRGAESPPAGFALEPPANRGFPITARVKRHSDNLTALIFSSKKKIYITGCPRIDA
jgi:hypothetical protein